MTENSQARLNATLYLTLVPMGGLIVPMGLLWGLKQALTVHGGLVAALEQRRQMACRTFVLNKRGPGIHDDHETKLNRPFSLVSYRFRQTGSKINAKGVER